MKHKHNKSDSTRLQTISLTAAFLYPICLGIGTVMSKRILVNVHPILLIAIELSASTAFLWILVIIRGVRVPFRWQTIKGGLTGILDPGITRIFFTLGLSATTASNTSLIGAIEPIITIFLAWLFLRERVSSRLISLTTITLIGVLLVIGLVPGEIHMGSIFGDFLVLIGTVFAAAYVVVSKGILVNLKPLPLCALQQSMSLMCVLLVLIITVPWQEQLNNLITTSPMVLVWAAVTGIVQYALSFWLFLIALLRLRASVTPLYLNLVPVFTVGGAYLFLGEQLSEIQFIGACLIVVSVILISWSHQE